MTTLRASAENGKHARAERVIARCREIAKYTEVPGQITRTFLSTPMHGVHDLLRAYLQAAGITSSIDAAGNIRAICSSKSPTAPRILLGSHLDTVPNAGAFDGVLGVVLAIAAAEELTTDTPVTLEIIGFSEEEGVRFAKPFFGSMAATGAADPAMLELVDAHGTTLAQAVRNFGLDPSGLAECRLHGPYAAYFEVHIEQGPVLESLAHAAHPKPLQSLLRPAVLGVVDAIVGQSRLGLEFHGRANHAGTTPMRLRHDALAAAAEWIVAVETLARATPGLVATVGAMDLDSGAPNVIPETVRASLDVRHSEDEARREAVAALLARAQSSAESRGVRFSSNMNIDQPAVRMDPHLVNVLTDAVVRAGHTPHCMPSGAGHDAMILAPHIPSVMLFVPSPGGLSHHPEESVLAKDVEAALDTVVEFVRALSRDEMFRNA